MNLDPDQPSTAARHDRSTGQVGESPLILGYAGLLPQVAATAVVAFDPASDTGALFAFGYAALILSFLGGIWWGFGMSRPSGQQGRVALVAVLPSILTALVILLTIGGIVAAHWALVLLGCGVLLTLPVDRWLADEGIAPTGWMAMRVPLSIGLGALTILCGILP